MKNTESRRQFFKTLGTHAGIGLSLTPAFSALPGILSVSHARPSLSKTPGTPHFFVNLTATGAMDCTLGLDPKVHQGSDQKDIFIEYRPDQIKSQSGVEAVRFAPAAHSMMAHAKDIAVINGIFIEQDTGHVSRFINSGDGQMKSAAASFELAATTQVAPYGVAFSGQAHLGARQIIPSEISELQSSQYGRFFNQLLEVLDPEQSPSSPVNLAQLKLVQAQKSVRAKFDQEVKRLQEKYQQIETPQIMMAALLSGAAYQIDLDLARTLSLSFDTHSGHEGVHIGTQTTFWNFVSSVFTLFKNEQYLDGSLFDRTLFYVTTEFSRTPFLNASKGKDHNPDTTSVLLAGCGVQGGVTIGESAVIPRKDGAPAVHIGQPFDFKTQKVVHKVEHYHPQVEMLRPKHLIATISEIFGNPADFYTGALDSVPRLKAAIKAI